MAQSTQRHDTHSALRRTARQSVPTVTDVVWQRGTDNELCEAAAEKVIRCALLAMHLHPLSTIAMLPRSHGASAGAHVDGAMKIKKFVTSLLSQESGQCKIFSDTDFEICFIRLKNGWWKNYEYNLCDRS